MKLTIINKLLFVNNEYSISGSIITSNKLINIDTKLINSIGRIKLFLYELIYSFAIAVLILTIINNICSFGKKYGILLERSVIQLKINITSPSKTTLYPFISLLFIRI